MKKILPLTAAEVKRFRETLEAKLREVVDLDTLGLRDSTPSHDSVDIASDNCAKEIGGKILNATTTRARIAGALRRIRQNCYGICQECEERIPRERLNAVPWAERCVQCQAEIERVLKSGEIPPGPQHGNLGDDLITTSIQTFESNTDRTRPRL